MVVARATFSTAIKRPVMDVSHDVPNRRAVSSSRARLAGFSTPSAKIVSVNRGPSGAGLRSPLHEPRARAFGLHALRAGGVRAGARGGQARVQAHNPA